MAIPIALIAFVLTACGGNKLSVDECQKDADCSNAYNLVVSANQTVSNSCPRNSNETNPACESAMATLNSAESMIFPRLKHDDAVQLSASLQATR
jgi:hypothetical protein